MHFALVGGVPGGDTEHRTIQKARWARKKSGGQARRLNATFVVVAGRSGACAGQVRKRRWRPGRRGYTRTINRATHEPDTLLHFASDNAVGMCPEALEATIRANAGAAPAYGDDAWTARAADLVRDLFESDCDVYFTFNGTAANSLALASMCQSYHSVICHRVAHIETDECGAPALFSHGSRLLLGDGEDGKLTPEAIEAIACSRSDIHFPKPRVVSLTQPTEVGTVYRPQELAALGEASKRLGLRVHMDGARFFNAVVGLGATPRVLAQEAGVDVMTLGATKAGAAVGDAVVFFDRRLSTEFAYRCKQAGQLASKMRFLAAPLIGLLEGGAWRRHAEHANAMAARLAERLTAVEGVSLLHPCEANAVFVQMPAAVSRRLREGGWRFYDFVGGGGARFVCSWATTAEHVDALAEAVRRATPRAHSVAPGS